MSQADLLLLHIELLNIVWTVVFTWIGTTTAMLGAAYFVSTRIKISLLVAMLSLYAIFSAACFSQIIQTWRRILAVGDDLLALQASGVQLTQSASLLIANLESRLVVSVAGPLLSLVFIASMVYVIYCYKGGGAN
jgi:hypothetical protein